MRKLQIDLEELAAAMEDHSFAFAWYLDTQTGQLVERWLRCHDERLRAELDDWLEGLDVEPA